MNDNKPTAIGLYQLCLFHHWITHCSLVTPFGDMYLGPHWFSCYLACWRHQTITWTHVDFSSMGCYEISHESNFTATTQATLHNELGNFILKLLLHLLGANELRQLINAVINHGKDQERILVFPVDNIWKYTSSYLTILTTSDWRHRSGSTLVQVMACCLTATSHYQNQCWLIFKGVLGPSPENNSKISVWKMGWKITLLRLFPNPPGSNVLK